MYDIYDEFYLEGYYDAFDEADMLMESPYNDKGYAKYQAKMQRKGKDALDQSSWKAKNVATTTGLIMGGPLTAAATHHFTNKSMRKSQGLNEDMFSQGYYDALMEIYDYDDYYDYY